MAMISCQFRWICGWSWLAWFKGRRPRSACAPVIKWTLTEAVPWSQRH